MITVLCYKKCTTCQKAFKWLDANGVEYKERAIKEENPTCLLYTSPSPRDTT